MMTRIKRNWIVYIFLVGMLDGMTSMEKSWEFLWKLNTQLPYNLVIALLGIYPREIKTYVYIEGYIRILIQLYS